jgi:hypothetical protein
MKNLLCFIKLINRKQYVVKLKSNFSHKRLLSAIVLNVTAKNFSATRIRGTELRRVSNLPDTGHVLMGINTTCIFYLIIDENSFFYVSGQKKSRIF